MVSKGWEDPHPRVRFTNTVRVDPQVELVSIHICVND